MQEDVSWFVVDFEFQQNTKTQLNDIFKQVVVARDWRTSVP